MAGVLEQQRWGYKNDCCLLFIGLPDSSLGPRCLSTLTPPIRSD